MLGSTGHAVEVGSACRSLQAAQVNRRSSTVLLRQAAHKCTLTLVQRLPSLFSMLLFIDEIEGSRGSGSPTSTARAYQ